MPDRSAPLRLIQPPPPGLAALVHYFHLERPRAGTHQLPASPFPILVLVPAGAATLCRDGVPLLDGCSGYLAGPFTAPLHYVTTPGTAFVSVLLRPGAAQDLFGIDQRKLCDAAWPLAALAAGDSIERLLEGLREAPIAQWPRQACAWLMRARAAAGPWRVCAPLAVAHFHEPPQLLARRHGLGLRQFERRFCARFGLSPRQARRQARFFHALSAIMAGRHAGLAELAQRVGYYDQAQMTRDFAALAGHPPGLLGAPPPDAGLDIFRYSQDELRALDACERAETLLALPDGGR